MGEAFGWHNDDGAVIVPTPERPGTFPPGPDSQETPSRHAQTMAGSSLPASRIPWRTSTLRRITQPRAKKTMRATIAGR